MVHAYNLPPVVPAVPVGLTRSELGTWLGIGKNEVGKVIARFGLVSLEGYFPERDIWEKILEVQPTTDTAAWALREPLADVHWVAWMTGKRPSTIRNKVRAGTFDYGAGVQLGARTGTVNARLRRWNRECIRARREGRAEPEFMRVETDAQVDNAAETPSEAMKTGPFAAIATLGGHPSG
ncbi:hypothetical protein GQE99_16260 [Maritimibacter sp. DP07]|uniref:Uncharacterized protein n=1 Tax=Maritimibacter harenae TaxID=2606218 RepID=A0A845MAX9_9RHOB|nr:hypothetical protein [Maritimibacter harenae]MZR14574.1 hypothetical protein [Maritimibacter harenae]